MTFTPGTFPNFIADLNPVFQRVSPSYTGASGDFDIIIVGSGIGGGVLADALADMQDGRRILVLEAGTFLYPTHVYNCARLSNDQVAKRFGCRTFWQAAQRGDDGNPFFIGEFPQMNLGGRSIFWSGLIPTLQDWELDFFPDKVRAAFTSGLLDEAGRKMNQSLTLGDVAEGIVQRLRATDLAADFEIVQTPRALDQPYLQASGEAAKDFPRESTGVFNTAELLVNQLKLSGDHNSGAEPQGLKMLLNHYVEDVIRIPDPDGRLEVVSRNTLTGEARFFRAKTVVLAGGSIESPKLLRRSTIGRTLDQSVQDLIGVGLTDHPTTGVFHSQATHIAGLAIPRGISAKIILYSRGLAGDGAAVRYPFNIEMNVNHEYWHLRENDPSSPSEPFPAAGPPSIEIKFSFGNPLDPDNAILSADHLGYVPEIRFRNQSHTDHLRRNRFPALAGWPERTDQEIFDLINGMARRVIGKFDNNGVAATPWETMGQDGHGFGWGTVHHAVGSLRMPSKARHDQDFTPGVVEENLEVRGGQGRGLYVCDMSVMPFSAAANPVRHLVALALRLAKEIG
ncbi:GMC oxidoreductase [Falsiroseomonas sp. HC035]|uniref:GMC oxidoreductase n=1 Tax=Falsiroseomonas sp. HC035 TaxID=3390999 RepID=UPI003D317A1A